MCTSLIAYQQHQVNYTLIQDKYDFWIGSSVLFLQKLAVELVYNDSALRLIISRVVVLDVSNLP